MTPKILHFSLGPVQDFISEARRTRDLWAGSFLLSWLSGQAMAAVEAEGGEIIFPEVKGDLLFEAIKTVKSGNKMQTRPFPYIGTLPNCFKAVVTNVDGNAGEICKKAITDAWETLAKAVFDGFIGAQGVALGCKTEEIWDEQVKNFWEFNWVAGPQPDDGSDNEWLGRRKNWRSIAGPQSAEGGDLCRLMGHFQEISGHQRTTAHDKQLLFWQQISRKKGVGEPEGIGALDLKADERLCSIALIKRLFPRLSNIEKVIGWKPGEGQIAGEGQINIVHWPSVSYIAAIPWLKAVEKNDLGESEQRAYLKLADDNLSEDFMGESATELFGLPTNRFFKLDGHLLHQDGVADWPEEGFKGENAEERREHLKRGLKGVQDKVTAVASEFYAVLLMDGDNIGKLRDRNDPAGKNIGENIVKKGLARFAEDVKKGFRPKNRTNATLIYAGGDDVLLLVPVDTAIEAAQQIRAAYGEAFAATLTECSGDVFSPSDFTMSAALIFAQYKIPFSCLLKHARHFLENVAKEQNGRDSLALAVVKPGGISCSWVSVWEDGEVAPVETLRMFGQELHEKQHVSSSIFHNLKNRYGPLFMSEEGGAPHISTCDPQDKISVDSELVRSVIRAELAASGKKQANIEDVSGKMLTVGQPLSRQDNKVNPLTGYDFDSGLISVFLRNEGRWRLTMEKDGNG